MKLSDFSDEEVQAAHEEVWSSKAGRIVLLDLEQQLDVFGADYVTDDALAEVPHPYRAYEERGMMRSLKRMRAMIRSLWDERLAIGVGDEEQPEEGEEDAGTES